MLKKYFKNISILFIVTLLLINTNMLLIIPTYLIQADKIENTTDKHSDDEPAETNPIEKVFEKSEFIVENLNSLFSPLSSYISNCYSTAITNLWKSKKISIFTPPPNLQ
jgi:hypothetical protein